MLPKGNNPSRYRIPMLLLLLSGTAALLISCASAGTGVTISADGDQSYYLGEKVVFRGQNAVSDSTYLFLTGPNLPATGGNLASPNNAVVSGNPDTFTLVKTDKDKTWEYPWFTAGLRLDAGTYTVYAMSDPQPKSLSADASYGSTGIIIKKPFVNAAISPSSVSRGQPFSVTGTAEGFPPEVQIWIVGDAFSSMVKTPVNSTDASFTFNGDAIMSGKLPAGQNYLIVQHPMADNQFDFVVSGDHVRNLKLNNGTNVFRLTGSGSLQGSDAADALITAISNQEVHDTTLTNDTYTIIPFRVTDSGSPTSLSTAASTAPAQQTTRHVPLQYAPIGALVLIVGIGAWRRQ